jgi:hypothetical protein
MAALVALLSPQVWLSVGAAPSSPFSLVCGSANAGSDVSCTLSRLSGGRGIYVLVKTFDVTAKAGTDYTAINQLYYFKSSILTQKIPVHTVVNPAATGILTFKVVASEGATPVSAIGSIVEPAPPPPPPPPSSLTWVPAPLHDGGFARVTNVSDPIWETEKAGMNGPTRSLVAGEIVAVYFNGWGIEADGSTSYAVYSITDGAAGRVKASDIQGVAPSPTLPLPPTNMSLPADWWVPGLVKANKTCPNANHPDQPGVTQGGVYRAAMLAGTHMQLASGQVGWANAQWIVFAADDPWQGAREVVTGDCLTGV